MVKQAFALEGKAPLSANQHMSFDFFAVPWGYGWVFPKADHANVGIITFNRKAKLNKHQLLAYTQRKLGHTHLTDIVGHPLGLGPGNGRRSKGRILFVGDAAGSVELLMGEGIHNAIMSGQLAAKATLSATAPWRVRLAYRWYMRPQTSDLTACHHLHHIFYRFPTFGYWALTRSRLMAALAHGFASGKTTHTIIKSFIRACFWPVPQPPAPPPNNH